MATEKQKRAIAIMVENGGNASKAMIAAGYSPKTATAPSKLTQSKGFDEICFEAGLTDTFIIEALQYDIAKKPLRRVKELSLAAEIRGMKKQKIEMSGSVSVSNTDFPQDAKLLSEYESRLRQSYIDIEPITDAA